MAITLIVEDGSVVAGANTFIDLLDARDRIEELGLTLSADDETAKSQLTQGYYQLKRSYQNRTQGCPVDRKQTGLFPREGVHAYCEPVPSDEIPEDVINAQLCYADSINKGSSVNDTTTSQTVKSQSLDGVGSKTYMDGSRPRTTPNVPGVTQWLQPYLRGGCLTRPDYFYDGKGAY